MSSTFLYPIIALLIIAIVAVLLRPGHEDHTSETRNRQEFADGLWESQGLSLAERILDPADYFWLRDELGFPSLAESLRRHRKHLALQWLNAVRSSFSEMVRTPEAASHSRTGAETPESWQLLRQTLRFHLLLGYAILVVRCFGPYHRLIPSFTWMGSPWGALPQSEMDRTSSLRRSA